MNLINDIKKQKFSNNCEVSLRVFEWLQSAKEDEYSEAANTIALIYPTVKYINKRPNISHTPYALFVRHLFSVKHKNGTLISQWHPERRSELKSNIEACKHWNKSFSFVKVLDQAFEYIDNKYGQVILYEVLAHRYGDLAVLEIDKKQNIGKMKKFYKKSAALAETINCKKQEFTPWYWGGCYFAKMNMDNDTVSWLRQFHIKCDVMGTRPSYVNKAQLSIELLRNILQVEEFMEYLTWLKKQTKSPAIKKALNRMDL